jgi:hypothetical protein
LDRCTAVLTPLMSQAAKLRGGLDVSEYYSPGFRRSCESNASGGDPMSRHSTNCLNTLWGARTESQSPELFILRYNKTAPVVGLGNIRKITIGTDWLWSLSRDNCRFPV